MYGHQHTKEPGSAFWGEHCTVPGDPGGSMLYRTVNFFSMNSIYHPEQHTAVAVRYGYNHFDDGGTNYLPLRRRHARLPGVLHATCWRQHVPEHHHDRLQRHRHTADRASTTYVGQTANATVSRFMGKHSMKMGADYRRIGADAMVSGRQRQLQASPRGSRRGRTPTTASTAAGDAFASFLLGYPATGDDQRRHAGELLHRLLLGLHPGRLPRVVER